MERRWLRRVVWLAWLGVAVWRAVVSVTALAAGAPLLALVALLGQTVTAAGAAFAIARRRGRLAGVCLGAFVAFVVLQVGLDVLAYGIRPPLDALAAVLAALALAALGVWALAAPSRARAL